jgi:hypothetical protein
MFLFIVKQINKQIMAKKIKNKRLYYEKLSEYK